MGRKKIEKVEINDVKTDEKVSADTNTLIDEKDAVTEEGVKNEAENPVVEQAKNEEENAIDKIVLDGVEIPMENAVLENELMSPEEEVDKIFFDGREIDLENATFEDGEFDLTPVEEIIKEAETDVEIVEVNEDLINLINGIELILDSNQDVDFDILNLKNQIRRLIAEFK